ncbi:hypothetical protein HYH02_004907 [Chlamydomonas schloesseri]|uniref:F-box domain-containing protein n=1 Tax=Chlamydomonas schloesseri TaxID=2026947 RepID=A0A835WPK5_9CHLO|nr:hypothetical protein HYH02_004907 [Chlamydomonas schloesseri]|eukprot:KAG2450405.1 hypothetical protein HYH02_004907 [Chlamydomonas schloesseri]
MASVPGSSRPPAITLEDILRTLDAAALGSMLRSLSTSDLLSARLACRGLRDACSAGVRQFTVSISQRAADSWRPGRRSPLCLFPFCSHLTLRINLGVYKSSAARAGDDRDGDASDVEDRAWDWDDAEMQGMYPDSYSHPVLARLAVAGVSPEALGRITALSLHADHGEPSWADSRDFDLAGVLCTLAPVLPGLQSVDASQVKLEGGYMRASDRSRPALMYAALGAHCPRLHELRLPVVPGILHGVGALAGCSGLRELSVFEAGYDLENRAVLGPEAVAGLSQLRSLRVLRLCCHDRSPEQGANLAALLGGRRPPALEVLELAAAVRVRGAPASRAWDGWDRWRRLPFTRLSFAAGSGRIQDVSPEPTPPYAAGYSGSREYDTLAQVLLAAADQLPHSASPVSFGRLAIAQLPLDLNSGTEEEVLKGLRPDGPLARLAARCARVELGRLDARSAVSGRAVCAVVIALGLPAEMSLRLGLWQPPGGGGVAPSCQWREVAASAMRKMLPPLPRAGATGAPQLQHLESAAAEDVMREAIERLWLAAAAKTEEAAAAEAEAQAAAIEAVRLGYDDSINPCLMGPDFWELLLRASALVFVRGVAPSPLPPPCQYGEWDDWPYEARTLAPWLDAAFGPALATASCSSAAEVTLPSSCIDPFGDCVNAPCAGALLLPCPSLRKAAALVAAIEASAAAGGGAAAAGGGSGGGKSGSKPEAIIVPRHLLKSEACSPYPMDCGMLVRCALVQVLSELWVGRSQLEQDGAGGETRLLGGPALEVCAGGSGGQQAASGKQEQRGHRQGGRRTGEGGDNVGHRLQLLLELDKQLAPMLPRGFH